MTEDSPALLTVPQAAAFLRVSRSYAYELIRQNLLPHIKLGPRKIRIPRHKLEEWLESSTQGGSRTEVTPPIGMWPTI